MMKSFFKKLAFVMALAMVVSAMAPAATAKAATVGNILRQEATSWTDIKTTDVLEVDATQDYKFGGAPSDWRSLGLKWESSKPEFATVDQTGLVKAVAAGETVISVKGEGFEAAMTLTVKAKEVVPAYEVKQTAGDKLTITWADAKEATTNVEVYKVYKLTDGTKEVKWPSETAVKDGVATVTVKYGGLEDGCDYVVKFGTVEKTITARLGKVVDIEVKPVAYEYNEKNEVVDLKGLYVSEDDEFPIRFDVTYITDNDIKLTTAPEDTYVNFEVLEGGDDIYLDSTGVESYIYEKGAWAHVVATYYYTENEVDKELEYDFWIEGVEKETAKFSGITKYTLVAVDGNDEPKVEKKDVAWDKTEIIVDDRAYVALEVADTLGGTTYAGLKDATYDGKFGTISYLSANDEILLVGEDGLVTPVATGTTAVIVQLTYEDANGNDVTKNVYAFDVTVKASRAAKKVSANSVTVLMDSKYIASKADVEVSVIDIYDAAWTGWTAKVETTAEVPEAVKSFEVKDIDDGKADGKVKFTVDGSEFANCNLNSVTYKVTVDGKTETFKVTLKNNASVSGYVAEVGNVTINGKQTGVINGEVKVYSFWRNNGVVYKLENVTDDVVICNGSDEFWTKNTTDLKGELVVTVKNPKDPKYTAVSGDGKIIIPSVANVDTEPASGGALTVTEGTYTVTVNEVKNTSFDEKTNTYKVTRKSTEDEKTFTVTNAATKLANPVVADATVYAGNSIKDVIAGYVTFTLADNKEYTVDVDEIVSVDCIENAEAGKIYVKSVKVLVPVYNTETKTELNCFFEQTLTINKLLPCTSDVFAE